MSKNEKWITRKQFYNTPKSKKEAYYLEKIGPLGEELIGKFYNKLDKEAEQEEGSMTKSEFIELHGQLSTKAEQRISEMLSDQTRQVVEIVKESEQRVSNMLTTKFDQMEQKRLADKAEMNQKFNEFKSEIRTEINQKFDLVFATMENNQTQTNNRLDRIEEDIRMLKSFHEEDIKKYNKQN